MPKFALEIPHTLSIADVRQRLEQAAQKLERDYGVECKWNGDSEMVGARSGLKARVKIEAARVAVDLDLGLLLTPLSGKIRDGISRELSAILAAPQ